MGQALGAIGLVALSLLAILPAHASGLKSGTPTRVAPGLRAIADEGNVGSMVAPLSMATRRSEAGEVESAFESAEVRERRSSAVRASTGLAKTSVSANAEQAVRAGAVHAVPAGSAPPTIGWYRLAAVEQAVSAELLRALHEVESNGAPDGCVANAQGSGAVGPFQFKPATFRKYSVDGNYDGHRDICSFADALFSAARYLRALGAGDLDDPGTRVALARYGTDPDRVLSLALSYRDRAALMD
jgi:hypothetical protein